MPYRQYKAAVYRFLRGIAKEYRDSVLPSLRWHRKMAFDSQIQNDEESWFISLEQQADGLEYALNSSVVAIMAVEAERHTHRWVTEAKKALSVDLSAVVRNEDLSDFLKDAATRNASLIKSLRTNTIADIRRLVIEAKISGQSIKQLTAEIQARLKVARSRAELIATDQLNKLTADLNQIRQQQAGIDEYSWQDSRDERVRERHRNLRNKRYKWGEPTGAEGGLPPGKPVRCRCTAKAVVTF